MADDCELCNRAGMNPAASVAPPASAAVLAVLFRTNMNLSAVLSNACTIVVESKIITRLET